MNQLNCVSWLWAHSTDPTNNLQLWSCYSLLHNCTDCAGPLFQHSTSKRSNTCTQMYYIYTVYYSHSLEFVWSYSVVALQCYNLWKPTAAPSCFCWPWPARGNSYATASCQTVSSALEWCSTSSYLPCALSIPPQENCIKSENTDIHSDFSKWLHG